ncbi:putative alcohol dehydrogenase [Mycena albidolilacea]|uniref:Alcohol dehydrogenase n=1 Tax=Mycena albidolilacea TaxID=1033008 RepID=A0AAD7EI15_9AGAR|nr:putative alcohol dehydrogenase [Mycena albidolilacea]
MAPKTQRAILVTEIGEPVILVDNHPVPEPGTNEVQIKISVAGLNPHDQKARDTGLFIRDNLPAILTNDVVGRISQIGDGVTTVAVGDRVVAHPGFTPGWTQNGLQEYCVVDTGAIAKLPDTVTDDTAATLPTNIVAPLVALFDTLQIPTPWLPAAKDFDYAATVLLVVGGGSSCGKFGVQLAKLAGIGKIVVVGGNEAELKGFGATHVVDRHGGHDAVLGRVRDIVGDNLLYAYDAVNPPPDQLLALEALSGHKRGALARLLPLGPVDETKVRDKKAGFDVRDVFGSSQAHPTLAAGFWARVPGLLETGQIKPLGYVVKQGLQAAHVNDVLDCYRDALPVMKTHIHF